MTLQLDCLAHNMGLRAYAICTGKGRNLNAILRASRVAQAGRQAGSGRWQVGPATMTPELVLYSRASSSASYRARIALNLKQAAYTLHTVATADQLGKGEYLQLNPQGLIPLLVYRTNGRTMRLSQSVAILEFLEESYPDQGQHLLPTDVAGRARVRSLALHIACDMQPLNNTRVVKYIKEHLGGDSDTQQMWSLHWAELGLQALEEELSSKATGKFCHGNEPTMADCCLVPQVNNKHCPLIESCIMSFLLH